MRLYHVPKSSTVESEITSVRNGPPARWWKSCYPVTFRSSHHNFSSLHRAFVETEQLILRHSYIQECKFHLTVVCGAGNTHRISQDTNNTVCFSFLCHFIWPTTRSDICFNTSSVPSPRGHVIIKLSRVLHKAF